jgi:hypothetical protein
MKRHPLFFALAAALGLAVTAPAFAKSPQKQSEVKALHALVDKQQKQLDEQQQELQALRETLQRLEGNQMQQQQQLQAQASAPPPAPAPAPAPVFSTAPGVSVALHGFVNATAFSQDKSFTFGNGQNAEFPKPGSTGRLSGVDVRNTRFWLDFKGSKFTENWNGAGRIEMDFFGGFNGTGAFSQQQPNPRLRQAYMDLINPSSGSTVRIGQQWDLMIQLDNLANSLSHIAFPLGYGTGLIGWRFPGVVWMQDLNHGTDGPKWRLDLGAFNGSWNGPGDNVNYLTAANAGFRPQLEARLHVEGKDWLAYLAGHYSKIDLKGVGGGEPTPVKSSINSEVIEVGGKWHPGPWVLTANVYTGKGHGQIFGDLVQFGDIQDTGGYLQAGYHFTPNWSGYAYYGYSKPDRKDVIAWLGHGATGLLKSRQAALSLQYSAGAYDLGVEWIYDKLDSTPDGVTTKKTNGNQVSLSALYHF